ncbi:MAG TPA: CBO0543 family protein [Bacillales bacterium]
MERLLLWGLIGLGIVLLFLNFRQLPIKDWLIIFLFTSYISVIAGTIVVEEKMLYYPVKLLDNHFDSSLEFEMLLLPAICLYFYRTTYHATILGIVAQSALYSIALTAIETLINKYTNLIEYNTWTWFDTLISVFLFIIFVRVFIETINRMEH